MLYGLLSLYAPSYASKITSLYVRSRGALFTYYKSYWSTARFDKVVVHAKDFSRQDRLTVRFIAVGMALQALTGAFIAGVDVFGDLLGGWQFGLAILLATPLVWAHILPLVSLATWIVRPKALGRAVLCAILESQVRRLRKRHSFKVVAVAGSVGKTSTKIAIAKVLQATRRVRWQEGNYNDRVTVPLIFFGHTEPGIFNIPAWLRIIRENEKQIARPYPYDIVVAELGTDGPGFMQEFAYVKPDIAVVSAVTPEHMEFFGTLDAVAREELTIMDYSAITLVNVDDAPAEYLEGKRYKSYGFTADDYRIISAADGGFAGQQLQLSLAGSKLDVTVPLLGAQGAKIALAAIATAHNLGLPMDAIAQGAQNIEAFAGRMRVFKGIKDSILIDDTYNASPVAMTAALDVLYAAKAPQRIAILGSMNELGDYSPHAHKQVGEYCDPRRVDIVIALGPDAVTYLAPVAEARGCHVEKFLNPYEAGQYIKDQLQQHAVVLAKGSQNRVFAEESLKALLVDAADEAHLVRQSPYWMRIKAEQFNTAQ